MWWWLACVRGEEPQVPVSAPVAPEYSSVLARLQAERTALRGQQPSREEARAYLMRSIEAELLPRWIGTHWEFYGTTETPGTGAIACGHFVGTVLRDAGFQLDRLAVGRLPSGLIVDLFADPSQKRRFRGQTSAEVAAALRELPEGLYVVGLDYHAGLLVRSGEALSFCNASPYSGVVCEDPASSLDFESKYRVVGPVLTDRAVDRWMAGERFEVPEGW
jgi:hypothetical protein